MVDPITALSVASAAVGQMRSLLNAGRDTSQAISKFAGAWSDINEAERQAKNPPWYKTFGDSLEQQAAQAFACKKKAEALKKELEDMIRYVHGPSGLEEYKTILREMKEQKRKNEYKKAQIKQNILETIVGLIAFSAGLAVFGGVIWLVGRNQGRW